jgi:perosamine synthetase
LGSDAIVERAADSRRQELAFFGGTPVVSQPAPHADLLSFTQADKRAVMAVLDRPLQTMSYFGREGELETYEEELAAYFGTAHVVLTNSGTSALYTAFFAAGVGIGDEVITSVYTFPATVTPVLSLGAVPVCVDIDARSGNLDCEAVANAMTERTRAIVATHQWGHPVDGPRLRAIADQHGLTLIEDVSLAVGATLNGRLAGTFGHAAALSLGSTKMFSGGQGGAYITSDPRMADYATLLGHFGRRSQQTVQDPRLRSYAATGYGHNFRMHPLAVAISRARFHRRDELIAARQERFARLSEWLRQTAGVLEPPWTQLGLTRGSWQGYCAHYNPCGTAVPLARFVQALRAEGLDVIPRGYQPCLHETRIFQNQDGERHPRGMSFARRDYALGDFPIAESHVASLVGFPIFLHEPMALIDAYGRACVKVASRLDQLSARRAGARRAAEHG